MFNGKETIMSKFLEFMKSITRKCLFIDKDIEIPNWTCYFFWFSISVILISEVFGYIGRHHF
jgi:hypothetical protein